MVFAQLCYFEDISCKKKGDLESTKSIQKVSTRDPLGHPELIRIYKKKQNFEYQRSVFCEWAGLSKIDSFFRVLKWMTIINTLSMNMDNKEQTDISPHLYQKQMRMTKHSCCCVK